MDDPVLQRLLAAVLADPASDLARLAYADRLEETGADDARAEFIRVQLGWHDVAAACLCGDCVRRRGGGRHHGGPCQVRRRERELLGEAARLWTPGAFTAIPGCTTAFRRGFVGEVALPCAAWLAHGPALVRAAPLTRVRLADREPSRYDSPELPPAPCWRWFDASLTGGDDSQDADELPGVIWAVYDKLTEEGGRTWEHPSRDDALDCLSAACLAWARGVAPAAPAPLD